MNGWMKLETLRGKQPEGLQVGSQQRWETVQGRLRAMMELAGAAFRADPMGAVVMATAQPFEIAGGVLQALALKGLADAAVAQDGQGVWLAGGLLAAVTCGRTVASSASQAAKLRLRERAGLRLQRRLGELIASIPTIEHFERPDYLRQIDLVQRESDALADLFSTVVRHISRLGRLAVSVGLMAALHPVLALLPLFGIPSLLASGQAHRIRRRLDEAVAEHRRLESHLQSLAWDEAPGKEVRVFGLADELLKRHAQTRAAVDRLEDRETLKATLITAAGWLVFAAGFIGAITLVVGEAVAGRATVGDVVLALTLSAQLNGSVADMAGTVSWTLRILTVAGRYHWLTKYADCRTRRRNGRRTTGAFMPELAPVPDRLEHGIVLEEVSFTYPGTKRVVLQEISLHLPAGSTVALVGENGAGKTTLVKLLCGMYAPSAGRIVVDGVDSRRLDVEEWRARTSAGFQDFARFMLLVRESVGAGDVRSVEDATAVTAAIERAHASDVLAQLPQGLETQLGRHFRPGVGAAAAASLALSEGQWQKLALGRAMMRPAPLLLVLDEPTASLDAPSEHALFERYAGAAQQAAVTKGGITLLVSHRFSTVRMANLIVVLEGGRVVASGSHTELVAQGGLYAELYEMQASRYRQ